MLAQEKFIFKNKQRRESVVVKRQMIVPVYLIYRYQGKTFELVIFIARQYKKTRARDSLNRRGRPLQYPASSPPHGDSAPDAVKNGPSAQSPASLQQLVPPEYQHMGRGGLW